MLEEVDRLTRLVEKLLTLTRGESGRIPLTSALGDLSDLTATCVGGPARSRGGKASNGLTSAKATPKLGASVKA